MTEEVDDRVEDKSVGFVTTARNDPSLRACLTTSSLKEVGAKKAFVKSYAFTCFGVCANSRKERPSKSCASRHWVVCRDPGRFGNSPFLTPSPDVYHSSRVKVKFLTKIDPLPDHGWMSATETYLALHHMFV